MERKSLVPSGGNVEGILTVLEDAVYKHGLSVQKMLNSDATALSAGDMLYFDKCYYGRVPTYQTFMRMLRKNNPELVLELQEMEAAALGDKYENGMRGIYEMDTDAMDGTEGKRFAWAEKLYKVQERKMDRIMKQRSEEDVEKGVDLAVRVIGALSNAQLLKAKEVMEAEWTSKD